jgi:hypothetical protein
MKRITSALTGLVLMFTLTAGAYAETRSCCDSTSCCNGQSCCHKAKAKK